MNEPVTYFPPVWLHNRAIVRLKGTAGPEYALAQVRFKESRESATVVLIAIAGLPCDPPEMRQVSMAEVEDQYEPTGRVFRGRSTTLIPLD